MKIKLSSQEVKARNATICDAVKHGSVTIEELADRFSMLPRGISGVCQLAGVPTAGRWKSRKPHRSPKMSASELVEWCEQKCVLVDNGCLLWTGFTNEKGYGRVKLGKVLVFLHRLVFEVKNKVSLTKDICVCHKCDTPNCIRVEHLFSGTNKDNVADRESKGRNIVKHGEDHPNSVLKEFEAIQIIDMIESEIFHDREIAELYGVSRDLIHRIRRNQLWKHLKRGSK